MAAHPTGTVTFLFTDIEGSTALWERDRAAMQAALEQHDGLLHTAIAGHGGHVFKTVGDAFCAAFTTAQAALLAALAAQRALHGADWAVLGDAGPLRVRMGVHTGEAIERDGDYFGPTVNRVARLEAAGRGGQLFVSQATWLLVRDHVPDDCTLRDWGEHRLKDLRHTEHIYQLLGPGVPRVEHPPAAADALHPRDRVRVSDAEDAEDGIGAAAGARSEPAAGHRPAPDDALPWDDLEAAVRSEASGVVTLSPLQAAAMARHAPADLRQWRLGRIAEWSQPRYRLDGRFVGLTLLVDQGEDATHGRWQARSQRVDDLGALVADTTDPALVLLGPPGAGKSTLLRRLELDTAIAALRGEGADRITFFASLSTYAPVHPGDPPPDPGTWLAERWAARAPALPPLGALLAKGRVTLLLDALNEMPADGEAGLRERVRLWKGWLQRLAAEQPGNRVVFSCRSLDYSQPLSTPDLRVPQVRIEPLSDDQVRAFLQVYSPGRWRELWRSLDGSPQLEVLRSPYFLALLVEQVEATGTLPDGRAGLFTGFVRQALRREVERGGDRFAAGNLLHERDIRQIAQWLWRDPYGLPKRGRLVPKLAELAHAMQAPPGAGGMQVRIDLDHALDLLDDPHDEAIVAAGEALSVLDEDEAAGELMFIHQLVQEYFAARQMAGAPELDRVRTAWRAADLRPTTAEVLADLDPADPLPPLPGTGWEETAIMAAAMADEPAALLRPMMDANLGLAARAASQPELTARLPDDLIQNLRRALAARCEDPAADLRDRMACADGLGLLGDPRLERREGPFGPYLLPPLVAVPAGHYPIGDDAAIEASQGTWTDHVPRHVVALGAFSLGRFPVTNAEWACFQASGGYEDERWWVTAAERAWRRGENTAAATVHGVRRFVERCRARPSIMDDLLAAGTWRAEHYARGQQRLAMSEAELSEHLTALYPSRRFAEPAMWHDARFNGPARPVVGVSWYEARAYAAWLAAQTGRRFRLPTEAEWEAAARGSAGRVHAYGDRFDPLRANTWETHVKQTTPVGVFADGATPEGLCDLTGNVLEWTSSAYGQAMDVASFRYPYDPADGREAAEAPDDLQRVARGGSWFHEHRLAHSAHRFGLHPGNRYDVSGFRLAIDGSSVSG